MTAFARSRRTCPDGGSVVVSTTFRTFLAVSLLAAVILWIVTPVPTVPVGVRWKPGLSDDARVRLERRFSLRSGEPAEGRNWKYGLADASPGNVRDLVTDPDVEDTGGIDRHTF